MGGVLEALIALMLVVAGVFGLVGSLGLIKLPDPMTRLHAPTKATTLGVGGVLVAAMIHAPFRGGAWSVHELMITLFLFLTAPITAQFIAKAYIHRNVPPEALPDAAPDAGWAVHDVKADDFPAGKA